jgi:serpin B
LALSLAPLLGLRIARAEAPPPADVAPLVAGHNAFALDLYGRLKGAGGNLLFSPYSIHSALAMTRAGAAGETAAQMDRVLHLPSSGMATAWKALVGLVSTAPQVVDHGPEGRKQVAAYSLSVANALWGQRGFPFVPAYRALLKDAFGAELTDVDFAQGPLVRRQINDWVLSKTHQKIKDLIPDGMPTADTRLALVNAIHFLAQWDEPFTERATELKDFTDEKGQVVKVRMMRRSAWFRSFEDQDARVLAIPYKGGAAEMLLVLPKDPAGLAALEAGLTPARVAAWGQRKEGGKTALELPRFKFEAATDLSRTLVAMGMPDAFAASTADFSGMASHPQEPLFIGVVLHKAFIAVDEKGTEAAAATAVMMRAGSAPNPDEPVPFVCDRPFLFFLRHVSTGALLFAGRLSAPEPATD